MTELTKTELTKEEVFSIVSKHLSGLTYLRKFAQSKDFEWLQDVHDKIGAILQENREDFERAKREAEEKEKKRREVLRMIEEMGFDIESLVNPITASGIKKKKTKKQGTRKPKYQFTHNGEMILWSGNGKKPLALQTLLDEGHTLEEFLIQS